jgi:hypothetical protein
MQGSIAVLYTALEQLVFLDKNSRKVDSQKAKNHGEKAKHGTQPAIDPGHGISGVTQRNGYNNAQEPHSSNGPKAKQAYIDNSGGD